MKLLVLGSMYGNVDLINQYIKEVQCDVVLCTGNIGMYYYNDRLVKYTKFSAGNFYEYIAGDKSFNKPVVAVPGVKENFKLVKLILQNKINIPNFKLLNQGEKYNLDINGEEVGITGLGRGYSPVSYSRDNLTGNRRKHFNRKDVLKAINSYESNIMLMHELPGPYVKHDLSFSDDTLALLNETFATYVFCGKYEKWFAHRYKKNMRHQTVLSFLPKADCDYGVLDTKTWNFSAISTLRSEENG